jgi:hypothetical protein
LQAASGKAISERSGVKVNAVQVSSGICQPAFSDAKMEMFRVHAGRPPPIDNQAPSGDNRKYEKN